MSITQIDADGERVRLMRDLTEQIGVMLGGSAPMTRVEEQHLDQLHDARLLCWGEVYQPDLVRAFYDAGATLHPTLDTSLSADDDGAQYRALRGRLEESVADHTTALRSIGRAAEVWDLRDSAVRRVQRVMSDTTGHPRAAHSAATPGLDVQRGEQPALDGVADFTGAELIEALDQRGVPAHVERTGGNVAGILIGETDERWAVPHEASDTERYPLIAGPGHYDEQDARASRFSRAELIVSADELDSEDGWTPEATQDVSSIASTIGRLYAERMGEASLAAPTTIDTGPAVRGPVSSTWCAGLSEEDLTRAQQVLDAGARAAEQRDHAWIAAFRGAVADEQLSRTHRVSPPPQRDHLDVAPPAQTMQMDR